MSEELATREGDSTEEKMTIYNQWAEKYDMDMTSREFRGPDIAAEACAKLVETMKKRPLMKVLDIACGTGEVGVKLRKHGFQTIDGIDGSKKMLEIAESKSVYNSYDIAVMSGGIGNNHVPIGSFRQIVRVVKPGGYVVNVTCPRHTEDAYYKGKYFTTFKTMQDEKLWEQVSEETVESYLIGEPGIVSIFRVL